LLDTIKLILEGAFVRSATSAAENTTIAVIATDAPLNKVAATKLAQMAQDALARTIRPAHTMFDGDTVFALSTSPETSGEVDPFLISCLGTVAVEVVVEAIVRSVLEAQAAGGLPAARRTS
jgi:L-aminopeptidase/D-esterase-like protein